MTIFQKVPVKSLYPLLEMSFLLFMIRIHIQLLMERNYDWNHFNQPFLE